MMVERKVRMIEFLAWRSRVCSSYQNSLTGNRTEQEEADLWILHTGLATRAPRFHGVPFVPVSLMALGEPF